MVDKYNLNLTGYPLFRLENLSDSGINLGDLTIAICILITVYFQKLLGLVRVSFGEHFIITALAVPVAIINLYSSGDTWLVSSSTPRDIIAMLVPLTIFVSVFNADLHILHQCLPQVLLLNTIGVSVFVLLFGFAMSCACLREIRWDYILCYGMAMVSSDSRILLKVLRTIDIQSTTLALLLSECVTTFANSLIIIDIYMGYADGTVTTIYQIVFIHSRMTFLGLLVGCSSGKLCTLVINPKIHNHKYLIMTWIIMAYIMYIICEGFMFCSGSLAVLSFAIFMSTEKNRVAVSAFQKMEFIIDSWHFIITAFAYLVSVSNSSMFLIQFFNIKIIFLSLCAYMFRLFARSMVVLCMYPFLFWHSKCNANTVLLMILSRRGVLELNKVQILLHHSKSHKMIQESASVTLILMTLEVLMNYTLVQTCIKNFGANVVSVTRMTNIASCCDMLTSKRIIYMHMFQMDRQFGDANWKVIQTATELLDSEKLNYGNQEKQSYGFKPSCLECQAYTGLLMTQYEKNEKLKELRVLVLRTQRVSFIRQRERGLILKSDLKGLFNALDVTSVSKSIHIEIPELSILYQRSHEQNLKKLLVNISEDMQTAMPTNNLKYVWKILLHPAYEIIIYLFIVLDAFLFFNLLYLDCRFDLLFLIPYSVFVIDAILRIMLFYNTNVDSKASEDIWNIFDACMMIVNTAEAIVFTFKMLCSRFNIFGYVIFMGIMFIGRLRLVKIIKLSLRLQKWIIRYCDYRMEDRVLSGYSRAISILFSYHEVLHTLPTLVDHVELRRMIEKEIVKEKAIILAQLNNVQYKHTRSAVISKTKRIINTSIATMRETIVALKLMGFTDEIENLELINRVEKLRKPILKLSYAELNSPSQILKWLPFFESMSGFEALYNAAVELEYEPESLILTKGKLSEGIYIVIDGLASMKLSMDEKVRARVKQYGALPVKDYLCDVDYYHASDHYVISGNSMGILSFLTNRPCDYDVRAIVKTRVFFLNAAALNMAMNSNSDPVHGLRSRLWKYVSVNLALSIMWRVPIYRNLRVEETYYYMEKSFVPNVSSKESICISEDVEDLILIEGRIRDKYSLKIYVAPCYVPRSVRKMQFIRNPRLLIEPQLFIIPFKPELHVKIYEFLDTFRPTPMFVEEPLQNRQSIFSRSAFNKRLNFSNIISPNVSYKKYARMPPRSSKNESIHTLLEDTDLNK